MRKSFTLQVIHVRGVRVGVWQITSPDIPGLLVTGTDLREVLNAVPLVIDELDRLSPTELERRRHAVVRAHADAARKG